MRSTCGLDVKALIGLVALRRSPSGVLRRGGRLDMYTRTPHCTWRLDHLLHHHQTMRRAKRRAKRRKRARKRPGKRRAKRKRSGGGKLLSRARRQQPVTGFGAGICASRPGRHRCRGGHQRMMAGHQRSSPVSGRARAIGQDWTNEAAPAAAPTAAPPGPGHAAPAAAPAALAAASAAVPAAAPVAAPAAAPQAAPPVPGCAHCELSGRFIPKTTKRVPR